MLMGIRYQDFISYLLGHSECFRCIVYALKSLDLNLTPGLGTISWVTVKAMRNHPRLFALAFVATVTTIG